MTIIIDTEFAALCPPLTPEEYANLEASIKSDGCRDALIVWQSMGVLLDGHNRKRICEANGITYQTREIPLPDREAAVIWILQNALARRNLTDDQRAMKASELADKLSEQAKRERAINAVASREWRPVETPILGDTSTPKIEMPSTKPKQRSRAKAAEGAKVPETKIRKAKKLRDKAPELAAKVISGELTMNAATKALRTQEIATERAALAKTVTVMAPDARWRVELGDIRTYQTDEQFDFILTDPPYPREYLELYEVLATRAQEWLKPGGLVVAMCGQSYLDQIMQMMGKHLEYYWMGCYLTPGQPTPIRHRQVNTTWKPILVYGLPDDKYKGKIFGDVWTSEGNDKEHHKWGQSVSGMSAIVKQVCLPGQSIFDPFCGAGTTGIAAINHGCTFRGIDIDEENVGISIVRIAEVSDDQTAQ